MDFQHSTQMCARHQVSLPYSSAAQHPPSSPTHLGSSILTDSHPESSLTTENNACHSPGKKFTSPCRCQLISIDSLPDEILLSIFGFFVASAYDLEDWQSLVHVCRRWRSVVFESPRRLNLLLVCEHKKRARETLDIWPALPLAIWHNVYEPESVDNVVAALERSDRVILIDFGSNRIDHGSGKKVVTEMQRSFPELTQLEIKLNYLTATALPDSFLCGSAPRLRRLKLTGISFPGLPKLLLSSAHIVDLQLFDHIGYISLEAMVAALSTLTSLRVLSLRFLSSQSLPDRESSRPTLTRSLLPVLVALRYHGFCEYLDDLVARIDAPYLNNLDVAFVDQNIFEIRHIPQFIQFITRTPTFDVLKAAHISYQNFGAGVRLLSETGFKELSVKIPYPHGELDLPFLCLERLCTFPLPLLSISEDLYIFERIYYAPPNWPNDTLRLELLRPFTAVKNLYLSGAIASRITPVLQGLVGDRMRSVARPGDYFRGGELEMGSFPGRH